VCHGSCGMGSPHSCLSMDSLSGVVQVSLLRISIVLSIPCEHTHEALTRLAECPGEASPKADSMPGRLLSCHVHLGPVLAVHHCPGCNRGSPSHLGTYASSVETLYALIHYHLYLNR
jgi:hypothetical protein